MKKFLLWLVLVLVGAGIGIALFVTHGGARVSASAEQFAADGASGGGTPSATNSMPVVGVTDTSKTLATTTLGGEASDTPIASGDSAPAPSVAPVSPTDTATTNFRDATGQVDTSQGAVTVAPPAAASDTASIPVVSSGDKVFTMADIATHASASSCYSAISGTVYDLTAFIGIHPGGVDAILSICGKDGTAEFMARHHGGSMYVDALQPYAVGKVE